MKRNKKRHMPPVVFFDMSEAAVHYLDRWPEDPRAPQRAGVIVYERFNKSVKVKVTAR